MPINNGNPLSNQMKESLQLCLEKTHMTSEYGVGWKQERTKEKEL